MKWFVAVVSRNQLFRLLASTRLRVSCVVGRKRLRGRELICMIEAMVAHHSRVANSMADLTCGMVG